LEAFIIIDELVSDSYFLFQLLLAAAPEPETKTDKTDLNKRKKFNDGL
jgi:hypothetical protein